MIELQMKIKKTLNKKVRNATIISFDGVLFKSKLELYAYKRLKEEKIEFQYEGIKFEITPAFTFENKSYELLRKSNAKVFTEQSNKIRPITYTPDFVGNNWIIETKGNPNEVFPIKWKLFKLYLTTTKQNYDLFVPRNHKQIDQAIEIIKQNEGILHRKKGK